MGLGFFEPVIIPKIKLSLRRTLVQPYRLPLRIKA
ncbi:MAG: hypothetical protein JWQ40_2158 [Segetibacter sp.]|nr:hypothetical protein [Segetibacter sp.]